MRNSTKNHLPISKEMETVLKRHLSAKYTQTVADDIWKNILTQYEAFTKDLPDLGGKRNRHNGPVAEFAKAHGYLNIMPAFCNCDYPAMEYINAALIRKHTCANSDVCDYLIVGDESKTAKEHPKETDEQGYWYNVGT